MVDVLIAALEWWIAPLLLLLVVSWIYSLVEDWLDHDPLDGAFGHRDGDVVSFPDERRAAAHLYPTQNRSVIATPRKAPNVD